MSFCDCLPAVSLELRDVVAVFFPILSVGFLIII